MQAKIPQFSLPLRFDDVDFVVNEQDTNAEIADCVQAVIRYPLGYRIELPQFGTPEQEFQQGGADRQVIDAQVSRWEPRADQFTTSELDDLVARVRIDVRGGTS